VFTTRARLLPLGVQQYCEEEQHPASTDREVSAQGNPHCTRAPIHTIRYNNKTTCGPLYDSSQSWVNCFKVGWSSKDAIHTPIIDTKGQDKGIQIARRSEMSVMTNSFVISLWIA
jgi:hypothetical protein